ncbi:hypothetical protein [Kutzneria kofuensis]|uniref:Gram-positive cocci surface proteins LPxTG domain-containing protein n=1 Tax=Kutzneria kofuensis TaxID=103725 RepID=A0A7W9KPP6_9PSEU|nr:hypothetical protein [Kutzneria kofuensis]MBB5896148.1 hypothetical protein [Kutzneria kofuensis]
MVKSGLFRTITAVLLTAGAALAASGVAAAATDTPPSSGDDRAVVYSGNAVTCDQAHLPGGIVQVTSTVDATNTYITVTGVPGGVTVTGIVVKGSDGFNVYLPGKLGALPWSNLHSPIAGNSGKPATISHWFACGTETTSSTSKTTSSTSKTSTTSTTSKTSTTSNTTTTAPGSSTTTTTTVTTTTAAGVATTTTTSAGTAPLAFTGFSGGWLVIIAAALLLGGAALIAIPKLRARRR